MEEKKENKQNIQIVAPLVRQFECSHFLIVIKSPYFLEFTGLTGMFYYRKLLKITNNFAADLK